MKPILLLSGTAAEGIQGAQAILANLGVPCVTCAAGTFADSGYASDGSDFSACLLVAPANSYAYWKWLKGDQACPVSVIGYTTVANLTNKTDYRTGMASGSVGSETYDKAVNGVHTLGETLGDIYSYGTSKYTPSAVVGVEQTEVLWADSVDPTKAVVWRRRKDSTSQWVYYQARGGYGLARCVLMMLRSTGVTPDHPFLMLPVVDDFEQCTTPAGFTNLGAWARTNGAFVPLAADVWGGVAGVNDWPANAVRDVIDAHADVFRVVIHDHASGNGHNILGEEGEDVSPYLTVADKQARLVLDAADLVSHGYTNSGLSCNGLAIMPKNRATILSMKALAGLGVTMTRGNIIIGNENRCPFVYVDGDGVSHTLWNLNGQSFNTSGQLVTALGTLSPITTGYDRAGSLQGMKNGGAGYTGANRMEYETVGHSLTLETMLKNGRHILWAHGANIQYDVSTPDTHPTYYDAPFIWVLNLFADLVNMSGGWMKWASYAEIATLWQKRSAMNSYESIRPVEHETTVEFTVATVVEDGGEPWTDKDKCLGVTAGAATVALPGATGQGKKLLLSDIAQVIPAGARIKEIIAHLSMSANVAGVVGVTPVTIEYNGATLFTLDDGTLVLTGDEVESTWRFVPSNASVVVDEVMANAATFGLGVVMGSLDPGTGSLHHAWAVIRWAEAAG